MTERARHIIEYSVLLIVSFILFFLFYYLRFERTALTILFGISSGFYALWGIVHHALEARLTRAIAMEYILFGLLMFTLLFFALNF